MGATPCEEPVESVCAADDPAEDAFVDPGDSLECRLHFCEIGHDEADGLRQRPRRMTIE